MLEVICLTKADGKSSLLQLDCSSVAINSFNLPREISLIDSEERRSWLSICSDDAVEKQMKQIEDYTESSRTCFEGLFCVVLHIQSGWKLKGFASRHRMSCREVHTNTKLFADSLLPATNDVTVLVCWSWQLSTIKRQKMFYANELSSMTNVNLFFPFQ